MEEQGSGAGQESRNLEWRRIWDKEGRNELEGRKTKHRIQGTK